MQAQAAAALADLTRSSEANREAVSKGGGIEPLVALLSSDAEADTSDAGALDVSARSQAAGALWSLASSGTAAQVTSECFELLLTASDGF